MGSGYFGKLATVNVNRWWWNWSSNW